MDKFLRTLRRGWLMLRIDHYQRQLDSYARQRENDNDAAEFIQAKLERAKFCARAMVQS